MALIVNGTTIQSVIANGTTCQTVIANGTTVFTSQSWKTVFSGSQLILRKSWKATSTGDYSVTTVDGTPASVVWSRPTRISGYVTLDCDATPAMTYFTDYVITTSSHTLASHSNGNFGASANVKQSGQVIFGASCSKLFGASGFVRADIYLTKIDQYY